MFPSFKICKIFFFLKEKENRVDYIKKNCWGGGIDEKKTD